jgi:hypothetical protein
LRSHLFSNLGPRLRMRREQGCRATRGHRQQGARSTRGSPDDAGEPEPPGPSRADEGAIYSNARHRLTPPDWWDSNPTPAEQLSRFVSADELSATLAAWIANTTEAQRAMALGQDAGFESAGQITARYVADLSRRAA